MVFRVFCRYFGFAANWENWGENDRMSEGVGEGEKKYNFSFPSPFSPTLGKLFTSPQLSTVFLFQDGGLNIRRKYISTRPPPKIRLHCRLSVLRKVQQSKAEESFEFTALYHYSVLINHRVPKFKLS